MKFTEWVKLYEAVIGNSIRLPEFGMPGFYIEKETRKGSIVYGPFPTYGHALAILYIANDMPTDTRNRPPGWSVLGEYSGDKDHVIKGVTGVYAERQKLRIPGDLSKLTSVVPSKNVTSIYEDLANQFNK